MKTKEKTKQPRASKFDFPMLKYYDVETELKTFKNDTRRRRISVLCGGVFIHVNRQDLYDTICISNVQIIQASIYQKRMYINHLIR